MTDEQIKEIIESGVDRSLIEYVMMHDELGEDFQAQLLSFLVRSDMDGFETAVDELCMMGLLEEQPEKLDPELEEKVNAAIDYLVQMEDIPKEELLKTQYLNLTYVMRHLFYNESDILEVLTPDTSNIIKFQTDKGDLWDVTYYTESFLTLDKRLDPIDYAILDVIYSLDCAGIRFFTTRMIDINLAGKKRLSTENSLQRIDRAIEKMTYIMVQCKINGLDRPETPLLSVQKFGKLGGSNCYYLDELNDLYAYANEMHQMDSIDKSYLDTSGLPKEYSFSDTELATYIKRRVLARVMGILRLSTKSNKGLKTRNRISLIQAKEKKNYNKKIPSVTGYNPTKRQGLFQQLGLMPDLTGLDADAANKKLDQWRKKQKPMYMKIIKGTLENLKRRYVILDYEEYREGGSKSLRDPVVAFDIICFTKSEINTLNGLREEQKAAKVQQWLKKRQETTPQKTGGTNQ